MNESPIPHTIQPSVDWADVNNPRTIAALATPPYSRVLDVGSGAGHVVGALHGRGCRVWAVERDAALASAVQPWCDRVFTADIETLDLDSAIGGQRFDAILLLDVLEHLREPALQVRRLLQFLAPGGRVVISVPNVAHAAVRLQLMSGRFTRTEQGLLDRTHLHFFERDNLRELLRDAGVRVIDEIRVMRSLSETEIEIDVEGLTPDTVALATQGTDALTYQFVLLAVPSEGYPDTAFSSLGGALSGELRAVRAQYRNLERWALAMEGILKRQAGDQQLGSSKANGAMIVNTESVNCEVSKATSNVLSRLEVQIEQAMSQARDERQDIHASLAALESKLTRSQVENAEQAQQALREYERIATSWQNALHDALARTQQVAVDALRLHDELTNAVVSRDRALARVRFLELELNAKDAYLTALREEAKNCEALQSQLRQQLQLGESRDEVVRTLNERVQALQGLLADTEGAAAAAESAYARSQDEVCGYQATLALPRYRAADTANRLLRGVRPLHRLLKSIVSRAPYVS